MIKRSTADLPIAFPNGGLAFDTTTGQPVFFNEGIWRKAEDNSIVKTSVVDLFVLAGQSNAHGHADVSTLTEDQSTQDGIFYTSWHHNTSNAETTQYYSNILGSLVAGSTRGDAGSSTLGGSSKFGPELGFVKRGNEINLGGGNPIGIIKYAVGASSLVTHPTLSDWDINATAQGDGDCWRGFQAALADAKTKLDAIGYTYNWKGMIWWQGESGTSPTDLNAFIAEVRNLMGNTYGVTNSSQWPFVITGNSGGWGSTLEAGVANQDAYIGFVDAAQYGQVNVGDPPTFNVHVGETPDEDIASPPNGINDMFDIGEAYADQMNSAMAGSTNSLWEPDVNSATLWFDANTATGSNGDTVTSISDRVSGNPVWNVIGNATITLQNAKKVVAFSPGDDTDYLQTASTISNTTGRQIWYVVARPENVNSNQDSLISQVGANSITLLPNSTSQFNGRMFHAGKVVNSTSISGTDLSGVYSIFAFDWDPATDNVKTYLNGALVETYNTQSAGTPWDLTMSANGATYRLMAQYGAPNAIADGYMAEVLITTNTADHTKTEGYLAWKWGLQGSLDAGHPYKNSAP